MTGNIIANKGFIQTYSTTVNAKGVPILAANVLAAWGGVQSAGQGFGMISMHLWVKSRVLPGLIWELTFRLHHDVQHR
jgi:hypothetical protein